MNREMFSLNAVKKREIREYRKRGICGNRFLSLRVIASMEENEQIFGKDKRELMSIAKERMKDSIDKIVNANGKFATKF